MFNKMKFNVVNILADIFPNKKLLSIKMSIGAVLLTASCSTETGNNSILAITENDSTTSNIDKTKNTSKDTTTTDTTKTDITSTTRDTSSTVDTTSTKDTIQITTIDTPYIDYDTLDITNIDIGPIIMCYAAPQIEITYPLSIVEFIDLEVTNSEKIPYILNAITGKVNVKFNNFLAYAIKEDETNMVIESGAIDLTNIAEDSTFTISFNETLLENEKTYLFSYGTFNENDSTNNIVDKLITESDNGLYTTKKFKKLVVLNED